jgi:hypothetical protein
MTDLEQSLYRCLLSYQGLPNIDIVRASLINECYQLLNEQDFSIDFNVDNRNMIVGARLCTRNS